MDQPDNKPTDNFVPFSPFTQFNASKRSRPRRKPETPAVRLRNLMVTKGATVDLLADELGCSKPYISLVLRGHNPSKLFIKTLAVLECHRPNWFMSRNKRYSRRMRINSQRARRKQRLTAKKKAEDATDKPYNPNAQPEERMCDYCQGDGRICGKRCWECRGEGWI